MTCISEPKTKIVIQPPFTIEPRKSACASEDLSYSEIQNLLRSFVQLEQGLFHRCHCPATPMPPPSPPCSSQGPVGVAADETARVWGDPHFEEPDGGKFDVQGVPGKTYNLLNDTGLDFQGRFDASQGETTVVGETGITVAGPRGVSQVQFSKDGHALLNGQAMTPGLMETLADGGHAHLSLNGLTLTLMAAEGYSITQEAKGSEMEIRVKSPQEGVAVDGRRPGGLIGQTFDADKVARNSSGHQGEGAISGSIQDYEVSGGVFGQTPIAVQQGVRPQAMDRIREMFQAAGTTSPTRLPPNNPITGNEVDGNQSLNDQNIGFMIDQANRQTQFRQTADSQYENDKLLQTLLAALQTGNVDQAMLLFSSLESREATGLTKVLTQKLLEAQENRRRLTGQLNSQDKSTQNQTAQIQANVQEVNDTIQLLTTFIRDVNEQKNRTMEFANNFLSSEHQTTMSIVRGMKS